MKRKLYIAMHGGMGDIFTKYFKTCEDWRYIQHVKQSIPDSHVKLILATHNPSADSFFIHHPHINEIKRIQGFCTYKETMHHIQLTAKDAKPLMSVVDKSKVQEVIPVFHLGDSDTKEANTIIQQGRYIFVHPFGSGKDRHISSVINMKDIINFIIDEMKYNVVVVGKSYHVDIAGFPSDSTENLQYERKGLCNLINKSNMRVCAYLASKSSVFLGSHSCFANVADTFDIPRIRIVPDYVEERKRKGMDGNDKNINSSDISLGIWYKDVSKYDLKGKLRQLAERSK